MTALTALACVALLCATSLAAGFVVGALAHRLKALRQREFEAGQRGSDARRGGVDQVSHEDVSA